MFGFLFLTSSLFMPDSRSICITTNGPTAFLFTAKQYPIVRVHHIFFTHSSVNGHLGYFHVLAIVNSAVVNKATDKELLSKVYKQLMQLNIKTYKPQATQKIGGGPK